MKSNEITRSLKVHFLDWLCFLSDQESRMPLSSRRAIIILDNNAILQNENQEDSDD